VINFGVSFCYNSARVWRVCQVSQGNVKTLFRWGEKRLHDFAANLLAKRCSKFHQNRQSFVADVTKTFWSLFFWTHCTCTGKWISKNGVMTVVKELHDVIWQDLNDSAEHQTSGTVWRTDACVHLVCIVFVFILLFMRICYCLRLKWWLYT